MTKSDLLKRCKKCFEAGAEPITGKIPVVNWHFDRKGKYILRARCANCEEHLGGVGKTSPLASLAPPEPRKRATLFDKDEYLVKPKDSAGDK